MSVYDLTTYADVAKLVTDKNYAKSKNIMVKKQNDLYVLKYSKYGLNNENIGTLGLFRSVITDGKSLLAFSPPKSISFASFAEKFVKDECIAEEFIEGTMINCFYYNDQWMISSRWDIGANSSFYQDHNITFRSMFLEAMVACNVTFDMLQKTYSYSFVLQHPSNRIVVPFSKPHLYLIAKYEMTDQWVAQEIVLSDTIKGSQVSRPGKYESGDTDSLEKIVLPYSSINTPYTILGIMLKHPQGARSKVRTPVYEKVRNLKGNSPKIQFQYYTLFQQGRIKEFLYYYPEYKQIFWKFRTELVNWTKELFTLYRNVHVTKSINEKDIPYSFRPHVMSLHDIYCHELRHKKMYVNMQTVILYTNNLPPQRLMYSINYPLRQKENDDVKGIS